MKEKKVSIIIPLYNNEKYIEKCIKSVLNQEYKNIEIIVINDGSTDSSEQIVKNIKSEKIKLLNQKNSGPSSARNNGIKNATGDWIIFLDSDDSLSKNTISTLIKNAKNNDLVIAGWNGIYPKHVKYYGPSKNIQLNKKEIEQLGDYLLSCGAKKDCEKIEIGSIEGPVAKLYSAKIIKENKIMFPENLSYAEDVCFNYNYLQYCKNIITLNEVVYLASRHSDSLSNRQKNLMSLHEKFEKEINSRNPEGWEIKNNVIYRYFYWSLEDLRKSSVQGFKAFKKEYNKFKLIDFSKLNNKYLTEMKKIELKVLNCNILISYILFKLINILKN